MSRAALATVAVVLVISPLAFVSSAVGTEEQPTYRWSMEPVGSTVPDLTGTRSMNLTGGWRPAPGLVGGAVEFTTAPSVGTVPSSAGDNPGTADFAFGVVFTSKPIPAKRYTGNVMQKGLFGDPGQVKLQLVPKYNGSTNCRLSGTDGARIISSSVNVDDGHWHYAVCWREGSTVGLTVDGISSTAAWSPGSVANGQPVVIGNRSAVKAGAKDQHFGRNDCSVYAIGAGARDAVLQTVSSSC